MCNRLTSATHHPAMETDIRLGEDSQVQVLKKTPLHAGQKLCSTTAKTEVVIGNDITKHPMHYICL